MTEELDINQLIEDANQEVADDNKLLRVSTLASRQRSLEELLETLEQRVKEVKAELEDVSTRQLPEAMLDAKLVKFTTDDYLEIKLEKVYYPSVLKEDEEDFYDWMFENEYDGIIKSSVVIDFGKGGMEQADEAFEKLRTQVNAPITQKHEIHWATFRAFARERMENDEELPAFFKVHPVTKAKIKVKE